MNIMQMMQQAQKVQKKIKETQDELANAELIASSNGDLVEVRANGQSKIISVKIKPEAVNSEHPENVSQDDIEILEDLIMETIKKAQEMASKESEERMKSITGGINIPGLF